jgi:ferredoxin
MQYLKNTVTLTLFTAKCTGCGICVDVCPREVIIMREGKASIISRDNCIECGACSKNCPFKALTVKSGVGCAAAVINGIIRKTDPDCGCCGPKAGCC